MDVDAKPIVFTPDNEPYLGRTLLFHFDQIICSAMEQNAATAPTSHCKPLSDHQHMACQVIAQSLSVALSIRELIRQGYLFGAHVLLRPLVERATILLYLQVFPEKIEIWNRGWHHEDAPGLAQMFDEIQSKWEQGPACHGWEATKVMNSLLHGKPDSAPWNLVSLCGDRYGHAVSKIFNRPELCDDICANIIPWLAVIQAMMTAYFPNCESLE